METYILHFRKRPIIDKLKDVNFGKNAKKPNLRMKSLEQMT
jgi:hypothetical protein